MIESIWEISNNVKETAYCLYILHISTQYCQKNTVVKANLKHLDTMSSRINKETCIVYVCCILE